MVDRGGVRRRERAAAVGAGGDGGVVAGGIGLHDPQDEVHVVLGVVVAHDRGFLPGAVGQVVLARAQVDRGGQGGVVHVLGVALVVAVGVDLDDLPGRGDELHRPDRAVEDGVVVELAAVGVVDGLGAVLAVERDAEDAGLGDPVLGQGVAAVAAVVGLDPADGGDQLPGDVAGLVGGVDDLCAALVGRQSRGGDAVGGSTRDHRVRGTLRDRGSDHTGRGHTRRSLDRRGGDLGAVGEVAVGVGAGGGRAGRDEAGRPHTRGEGDGNEGERLDTTGQWPTGHLCELSPLGQHGGRRLPVTSR